MNKQHYTEIDHKYRGKKTRGCLRGKGKLMGKIGKGD